MHEHKDTSFKQLVYQTVLSFALSIPLTLHMFGIPVPLWLQIVFATIGRLRGRALPPNFVMTTQSVFMVLLLSMVVYISFFDVRRWSRDAREGHAAPAAAAPAKP